MHHFFFLGESDHDLQKLKSSTVTFSSLSSMTMKHCEQFFKVMTHRIMASAQVL